jgi:NAD(P)H dehydrogenase (quinone)
MKVLAVFAHPLRDSSCGQILDAFMGGAQEAGHEIELADLYREGFQPAFTPEDYAQFDGRPMPEDVRHEQRRVEWSEGLALVFPVWWWGMPAMLRGYIDRVFSYGWAWTDADDPAASPLGNREALLLATAGSSKRVYDKYGYGEAMRVQNEVGTLGYWGLSRYRTHVFYGVGKNYEDGGPNPGVDIAAFLAEARALGRTFGGP